MITTHQIIKRWAIVFVASLALQACAPGTGGTGTGPIALSNPITFAGVTPSTGGGVVANPTPTPTPNACANVNNAAPSLTLQTDRIELRAACGSFAYAGRWNVSEVGNAEIIGAWESTAVINGQTSSSQQTATLTLSFQGNVNSSTSVTVSVRGSLGQVLLEPLNIQRVP